MRYFSPATKHESRYHFGRGGDSGSSETTDNDEMKSIHYGNYVTPPDCAIGTNTTEKERRDDGVTTSELMAANNLIKQNIGYGSMDCSAAMSAVTGLRHLSTAELMDANTRSSAGYEDTVGNSQAGTWTVVRYIDGNGQEVGHAQMNMGGGLYFDSTAVDGRNGPTSTNTSTIQWLQQKGYQIVGIEYMRPRG